MHIPVLSKLIPEQLIPNIPKCVCVTRVWLYLNNS